MDMTNVERVRAGFEAALRGDLGAIATALDDDVYWGPEGGGGCTNREQTLRWMEDGLARGIQIELVEARELSDGRVLAVLQRTSPLGDGDAPPAPHAQILSFHAGKITQMLVYETVERALGAAGSA